MGGRMGALSQAIAAGRELLGDLEDARYAWAQGARTPTRLARLRRHGRRADGVIRDPMSERCRRSASLPAGSGLGLGERVRSTPKPLLEVAGQPFLIHQLRLLRAHGATRVVLCVGYLGELIEERIGPERFGIGIDYSYDSPGLDGTLGAIRRAAPLLGDRFLVLYGDTYLRVDYAAAAAAWDRSGLPAMMTVLRNEGRWDMSNVEFDGTRVTAYDKQAPSAEMAWIDYGLGGLEASILDVAGDAVRRPLAGCTTSLPARGCCSATPPPSASTRSGRRNRCWRPANSLVATQEPRTVCVGWIETPEPAQRNTQYPCRVPVDMLHRSTTV